MAEETEQVVAAPKKRGRKPSAAKVEAVAAKETAAQPVQENAIAPEKVKQNDAPVAESLAAAQGHAVGEGEYDELHRLSEMTEAVLEAARILSSGDKSERDLRRKLKPKFSEEAIGSAVRLLKKRGYLDETVQCQRIAEAAVRTKHHGPARIKADLIARGYSGKAAEAAVGAIPDEDFEDALAYLIDRKFPEIAEMDASDIKKAAASLMRLGFSSGRIFGEIRSRRKKT